MDDFRSFGICPDIIDSPPFQLLEVSLCIKFFIGITLLNI